MEFKNENKDTRLKEAIEELEAVKKALIKKGTIKEEDITNEKIK